MIVPFIIFAVILMWAGSTMLIDAWIRRHRKPSLYERLAPYMPSVGDEAEIWLAIHNKSKDDE